MFFHLRPAFVPEVSINDKWAPHRLQVRNLGDTGLKLRLNTFSSLELEGAECEAT